MAGLAGLLRDIGTLEIPTAILDRPGPLEPDEAAFVRHHSRLGASLLAPYFEGEVVETVRHHHERYDGDGYPDGIAGTELPAAARIVSVVDTYHALISDRAYRPGRPPQERQAGSAALTLVAG